MKDTLRVVLGTARASAIASSAQNTVTVTQGYPFGLKGPATWVWRLHGHLEVSYVASFDHLIAALAAHGFDVYLPIWQQTTESAEQR